VCCSVWQCAALCYIAVCCTVFVLCLQRVAVCCSVLQRAAVRGGVLQCVAV